MRLHIVHFINLSDVLSFMGVTDIFDTGDPFDGIAPCECSYSLMHLGFVLDRLEEFLESPLRQKLNKIDDSWEKWNTKRDGLIESLPEGVEYVDMGN